MTLLKSISNLYGPISIIGLILLLFAGGPDWLITIYVLGVLYLTFSIFWKVISNFDNNPKRFLVDMVSILFMGILIFANVYKVYGFLDLNGLVTKDPADALYFSIVTWTTLGYGDFQPLESMRLIAAIEALIGYLYSALFLGFVAGMFLTKFIKNVTKA
ncbi:ion channel [Vibrio cholerae]